MSAATSKIREWRHDPNRFVREVLHATPDAWQEDVLGLAGKEGLKRIAMKACAGPGKTALLAWLGWHRLLCYAAPNEHPKGAAVSITWDNLMDNLWAELARWQNESPLLLEAFQWTKTKIFAKDHPETWFLSAKGWAKSADPETIGRTLSGQHSRFPFYLIDESGDIPPQMARSAEQGLMNCEDGLIVTAGNPTSHAGMLYEVTTKARAEWDIVSITADPDDPKRTPRVPIEQARKNIALHGRDNPWVMAYILGLFPPGSINALIGVDDVEAAMGKHVKPEAYQWAQKRIGVDVARFGDDRTVLFPRQGCVAFQPAIMRHPRDSSVSVDIASRVMMMKQEIKAETEFFDDTVGWAHGAIDVMRAAGHHPHAIRFDAPANDDRYRNMRAEMWMKMADWIKAGGALPNIPEMVAELTSPTYFFSNGKFQIESKDQIKQRLGRSPDCFVAGTMVKTPFGSKRIEAFTPGDKVLTPMGPRTVIKAWESEVNEVAVAEFSNNRSLCGKRSHEVFVWGKGWVALDALPLNNAIEHYALLRRFRWAILNSLFTPVACSGFKHLVATTSQESIRTPRDFFIGGSGRTLTGLFQRACRSITRMATGLTTNWTTWNWSLLESTSNTTCGSATRKTRDCEKASAGPETLPESGTALKLGESGTVSTASAHGSAGSPLTLPAACVASPTRPTSPAGPGSAPTPVNSAKATSGPRRRLASALSAVLRSFSTATGSRSVVPVSVQTVSVPNGVKVYNLTLDADNAYYANGILVANCADALALTFALPDMPASMQTILNPRKAGLESEFDPYKWE